MSWRGSGNFRGSGGSDWNGKGGKGDSALNGGSAGGPPIKYLIGGVIGIGVIALILIISIGAMSAGPPATVAAVTAAPATAAAPVGAAPAATDVVAAPTDAAAAPTAAAPAATVAPTAAPTATAVGGVAIPTEPYGPAVTTGSGTALEIGSDGELLAFDKTTLEVTAGQNYTLTFTNNSVAVQHNWVLIDSDADATAVANAATAAQTKARNILASVPPADTPGLLVAMPIINANATGEVTFTAPTKPGSYTFLCTFPAHYVSGMVGTLVVK